ncbi:hypothetical protein ABFV99_13155 [Cytobacillus horneckiae]|uniref:hypothetical protein n=1 Tax=Cytobacillus horneckiae TaxID=549687 RepID=UPI0034CFA70C
MNLYWEYAGNDPVAKVGNLVFRLHQSYTILKRRGYNDEECLVYQLQVRKKENISFKDLGYVFYMGSFVSRSNEKSVDFHYWDDISEVVNKAEEILEVLDFI